jgi:hypothetical protein
MDVKEILLDVDRLAGTVQSIEGMLMENTRHPFLGDSTRDWASGQCLHLLHDGIFDLLVEKLFPNIIGGGDTLFFYPATATGLVEWDPINRVCSISKLRSITVDIHGEQYVLKLV